MGILLSCSRVSNTVWLHQLDSNEKLGEKLHIILTLNDKPLKLEDQFIYFGSNISSTKSYVNVHIGKVWNTID